MLCKSIIKHYQSGKSSRIFLVEYPIIQRLPFCYSQLLYIYETAYTSVLLQKTAGKEEIHVFGIPYDTENEKW